MADDGLSMVPPLPPRYRLKDAILGEHGDADRVRVKFFTNENTLKERLQIYFIKNQRSSLRIRMFNFLIKCLSCVLYVARVVMEENICRQQQLEEGQNILNMTTVANVEDNDPAAIDWMAIFWVCRHDWFWGIQVTVAIISLLETLLVTYLAYKGNLLQQLVSPEFILELITTVPLIVTIFHPPIRTLFVPVFLNCWLAKLALNNMLNDLNRAMQKSQSALSRHLLLLITTLFCLVFTSVCGFQHLQRGSPRNRVSLFDSLWFVIVTFSTVGYGDMYPTIWPSKLFIMMLICMIFIVVPKQFEQLAFTWMERQKMGGSYSSHRAHSEKHVVVVATVLQTDVIVDFLNEFYAHPKVQDYYVVLLSPCDLNPTLKLILQIPIWAARVIYIQGSALKDVDLTRCRMQNAEACFFIMTRNEQDKNASDEHTILRSWAVRDFAPHCPQYLQIFKPESKIHVYSAEFMVCEDEFKYSLLANNCLYPGVSTFITLLLHTSDGAEGQVADDEWMRLYGRCSGNEIYHVAINGSLFFGDYIGKSFTYASFNSHRKYGVCLVGVVTGNESERTTLINPGCDYILKDSDICLYLSLAKEETASVITSGKKVIENKGASISEKDIVSGAKIKDQYNKATCRLEQVVSDAQHQRSELIGDFSSAVPHSADLQQSEGHDEQQQETATIAKATTSATYPANYVCGVPPVTPYIGISQRMCHLVKTKRHLCCLQLTDTCDHTENCTASDYKWPNKCVIVVADIASNALFNFIAILRAQHIDHTKLKPIILVVEDSPENSFLDTISYFPMVYWMTGSLESLDDLLKAGIMVSETLVVVNKEASNAGAEDPLADCNTLVAAQTIFRLFPTCNIVMELSQAANMKFMQFRPHDPLSLKISNFERKEREKGSHLYFMFRPPFASGCVFSASMLDTILYQAYVKDFVIQFVRLLLDIDEHPQSGHLSCMRITSDDMWIGSYGRLYQKLCSSTREIPIGIYRTQSKDTTFSTLLMMGKGCIDYSTMTEVEKMVRSRMDALGVKCRQMVENIAGDVPLAPLATPEITNMSDGEYTMKCRNLVNGRENISFVIINPSADIQLQLDDIIYVIIPPSN